MRIRTLSLLTGIALFATACAAGAGTGSGVDRDVITRAQMIEANAQTVYDAVQRLNAQWLTARGSNTFEGSTPETVQIYVNGNRMGGPDYLRGLRPEDVDQVRYYRAGEASTRFGMGNPRGVIEVIMRGQLQ